jgi:hypothetical protein
MAKIRMEFQATMIQDLRRQLQQAKADLAEQSRLRQLAEERAAQAEAKLAQLGQ